jgi:DNA repair protein RecO (recombination protein O)
MAIEKDNAVVLRLTEFSETSQIVTLFTERSGQVRLIAKGVRRSTSKRFSAGLDQLEQGEVSYIPSHGEAQLGTLTDWTQRETFPGLRRELSRLYGGLYAAELAAALTEEYDPHPTLFAALTRVLAALAAKSADEPSAATSEVEPVRALAIYQGALLTAIGYWPNFESCVECGRVRPRGAAAWFSSTAGGLLCRDCEMRHVEKRRLPAGLADTLPATGDARTWFELQHYHLTHLAGRQFKTARQLVQALSPRQRPPRR